MTEWLKTKEGIKVGYLGADFTPLEYLQRSDPRSLIAPKGFTKMFGTNCPQALDHLEADGTIYGIKLRNIIEVGSG